MKKEEIMKLRDNLEENGAKINIKALENQYKEDPKKAEQIVTDAAKFLGVKNAK